VTHEITHTYPQSDSSKEGDVGVQLNLWRVDVLQGAGTDFWTSGL